MVFTAYQAEASDVAFISIIPASMFVALGTLLGWAARQTWSPQGTLTNGSTDDVIGESRKYRFLCKIYITLLAVVFVILEVFSNRNGAVELYPTARYDSDNTAYAVLAAITLGSVGLFVATSKVGLIRRMVTGTLFGFWSGILALGAWGLQTDLAQQALDFPQGHTVQMPVWAKLRSAYREASTYKGHTTYNFNVSTSRYGQTFFVTPDDYAQMFFTPSTASVDVTKVANSVPDPHKFCIKLAVEKSINAARLLVGNREMPVGSIVACPAGAPDLPIR
jgi:hypothetical protein